MHYNFKPRVEGPGKYRNILQIPLYVKNDVLSPFPALTATHRPLLPPDRAQYVHIWNTVSLSGLSYWKFQNKVDPGRALAAP